MKYKGFTCALISTYKNMTSLETEHRRIADSGLSVVAFWGEQDKVEKIEDVPSNLKRVPNMDLLVIPKAKHLLHMEQAAMFNSILFDQVICCERK